MAERYDEEAIRSVLRELKPRSARIMWASKAHEVRCAPLAATLAIVCTRSEAQMFWVFC